ncbi:hypothetical protein COY33_00290 [candidate division WWE3 bacterium CG_4_10_14_0_2_um_filter_42_7]|uniref:Peptidase S11 D-alanyl-D-alanine carboxypeptidase A N-terminal domain-containing protein n=2 Tax=Katanobacteria TaxID=422282 RepID=A0A2H0XAL5_UNCKA|nr:MAG: hypothetical protein COT51_00080 [candidate division WWE3 bacterium CG08_land_8_20_14_0_20_41_15]PIZ44057.1 MAG: hypothetical protein COY33_00290 [candidate division WWE3 bacterium CG_4_10_14_0_2_um_filter_42_7]
MGNFSLPIEFFFILQGLVYHKVKNNLSCYNFLVRKKRSRFPLFILGLILAFLFIIPLPKEKKVEPISPVVFAESLDLYKDIWSPSGNIGSSAPAPEISAQSAMFVDLDTGKIIYEKNSRERRPVASLTKIMTALLALERGNLDHKMTVTEYAASLGEDSMYASAGEKFTLKELLYALMLNSANDAAETIGENLAGDRNTFVSWMNGRARELGLSDTNFVNASGLDEDKNDYSTAYDVLVMARTAIEKFPVFTEITGTTDQFFEECPDHKAIFLSNETNLLRTYPGCFGIKTGYTPKAGLCLVTAVKRDGKRVLGVILNSGDRRGDAELLLDYSYMSLGVVR